MKRVGHREHVAGNGAVDEAVRSAPSSSSLTCQRRNSQCYDGKVMGHDVSGKLSLLGYLSS